MRVNGLASGMDIDEIVKNMMKAQRVPLDKMNQKKQYTEWQRDDYRSMNTALLELDRLIFDGIGKQANFAKKTVNISNPNAVSIKSVDATVNFSGTIEVKNLATSSTIISNGSNVSITPGINTIKAINEKGEMQEYQFEITADDTMDSVIKKINSQTGVTAFYDENTKRISLTSKQSGNVGGAGIEIVSGDFLTSISAGATTTVGQNATVVYNGLEITRPSNTFVINGAEFTLKNAIPGETITFSSQADVDAVMETVVKFVDKYNEIVAKLKDKTSETRYRNFQPLSAEQKKDMSENDIKLWEEKAKSGTLKNDSTLRNLQSTMRTSLYTAVSGLAGFSSLSQIGITTTKNYLEGGKLEINEEKLRKAISDNPDGIYQMFMAEGNKDDKNSQGLARRLRSDLKSAMDTVTEKAGKAGFVNDTFSIGKSLLDLDKRITAFEAKLVKLETRYYSQFTAMEKAIQRANSQSAQLMQYFS